MAAATLPRDYHVDTLARRPRLALFRGVFRKELRCREHGDPLNLIRVMPAKGQGRFFPQPPARIRISLMAILAGPLLAEGGIR